MDSKAKRIIDNTYSIIENGYFAFGLLVTGWSPVIIVFGYWLEEAVNFLFTLVKLIYLKIKNPEEKSHIPFFSFAYGMFMAVHLVFVTILCGITSGKDGAAKDLFEMIFFTIAGKPGHVSDGLVRELLIVLGVVIVSAILYFYKTFLSRGRFRIISSAQVVNRSFGPIILPHFVIIFGVGGIILTGLPDILAVVLVIIKFLFDFSGFAEKESPIIK